MVRIALFLAMISAFSCHTGKNTAGDALLVELRTSGCFGYCPVIRLTVQDDGRVEYEGQQFAEKQGRDSFQLTAEEAKRLRKQVRAANLWQYPERIESQVVDAPWATLTVFKDGKTWSVAGSADRPEPLLELENAIKNIAEAHGFQVRMGVDPNVPPMGTRREVVVTLRSDQNAGNWIMQFNDIRLLLIRRVSAENKWIVAYDPAEISAPDLIRRFEKTEGVLSVQKSN
ncbi:MAG: hypothetical protein IPM98_04760 [Lewinellaceae bacterium]|nr:hypothetical protein [Lewinellaceae bacterium]